MEDSVQFLATVTTSDDVFYSRPSVDDSAGREDILKYAL